jgi:hypothetical protein
MIFAKSLNNRPETRHSYSPPPNTHPHRYLYSATTRKPITEYAVSGALAERYAGRV